jgi:inorganic triphosphatase YgiF
MTAPGFRASEPRELELKLKVPPEDLDRLAASPALAGRALGPARRRRLVSVYFDTLDARLRARGLALRVRRIGRRRIQTLKAESRAGGLATDRPEHEVAVAGDVPDLAAFKAPAVRELLGLVLPGELAPMFETRIERTALTIAWPAPERPEAEVEVALDRGRILARGRREEVSELELELLRGPRGALVALAEELRALAPLAVETRDKATRGWALAADVVPPPRKADRLALDPLESVGEALRRIGLACLGHWLANTAPAADGRDPEGLHQLRVALRRLRSALSLFRSVLPEADRNRLNGELRWLLGELGPARDGDVLTGELMAPLAEDEVLGPELEVLRRVLAARRPAIYERVRAALASRRAADLVLDLGAWLELDRFREHAAAEARAVLDGPIGPFAAATLERRWRKARKLGRRLERLDPAGRHALRIAVKKLRYGLDFLASLWPEAETRRFQGRLAELQDRLGHLNDVAVARDQARGLLAELEGDPAAPVAALALGAVVGWHARATRRQVAEACERWAELADEQRFWRDAA